MQTKLTLRLDEAVIRRAKGWARSRGISLSEAVAAIFAQLPTDTDGPDDPVPRLGPWTRRLIGAAVPAADDGNDERVRRDHRDHLERKHTS